MNEKEEAPTVIGAQCGSLFASLEDWDDEINISVDQALIKFRDTSLYANAKQNYLIDQYSAACELRDEFDIAAAKAKIKRRFPVYRADMEQALANVLAAIELEDELMRAS